MLIDVSDPKQMIQVIITKLSLGSPSLQYNRLSNDAKTIIISTDPQCSYTGALSVFRSQPSMAWCSPSSVDKV